MLDSIEAINKYKVSLGTEDQFANIMTFAKNMEIKDSKLYEAAENEMSKKLGKYLLKYYDFNLTETDKENIINLVNGWNEYVSNQLTNKNYLQELYGVSKTQDIENSLPAKIAETIISKFYKDLYNESLESYSENEISAIKSYSDNFYNYKKALAYDITKNYFSDVFNNITEYVDSDYEQTNKEYKEYIKPFVEIGIKVKINSYNSNDDVYNFTSYDSTGENEWTTGTAKIISHTNEYIKIQVVTNGIDGFTNKCFWIKETYENIFQTENSSEPSSIPTKLYNLYSDKFTLQNLLGEYLKETEINTLKDNYKSKDKILMYNFEFKDKNSASPLEIKYVNNGELINFFDFSYNDSRYIIIYKEFNAEYRKLLDSDITDSLVMFYAKEDDSNNSKFKSLCKKYAANNDSTVFRYFRNASDVQYYSYDLFGPNKDIIGTNKLFKYQYGNPYLARKAAENDIIKYYIADNYISNKYGFYNYQKKEIQNFLKIYKNVREYYYKVLLNESFINDDKYPFFERLFLIFWSVERFLSSKVDNLKDIDTYDLNDIKNFLKSFGFKKLSDIIDESTFYNSETYAAAIVKNYKNLINYKGSKKIIDILEKIFTVDESKLVIYKYILLRNTKKVDERIETESYEFVKSDYSSEDVFKQISENKRNAITLSNVVAEDNYWDENNTPKELLDALNVTSSNTKYLLPELTINVANTYLKTRCIIATINFLLEKIRSALAKRSAYNETVSESDKLEDYDISEFDVYTNSAVLGIERLNYDEYLQILNYALDCYLPDGNTINETYNSDYRTFKINTSALDSIKPYFKVVIPNNETGKTYRVKMEEVFKIVNKGQEDALNIEVFDILNCFKVLLYINELDSGNGENLDFYINQIIKLYSESDSDGISLTNVFTSIIDDMEAYVNFITNYFQYYTLNYETNNLLFKELFNIFFIDNSNKDCLSYTYSGNNDSVLAKISEISILEPDEQGDLILEMCKELSKLVDSKFVLNIQNEQDDTLKFLKAAIEFFISYTAEIYKFNYTKSYDTKMENCIPRDTFKIELSVHLMDTMYYDEELLVS